MSDILLQVISDGERVEYHINGGNAMETLRNIGGLLGSLCISLAEDHDATHYYITEEGVALLTAQVGVVAMETINTRMAGLAHRDIIK